MELIAALTIWAMFTCFILCPLAGLPPVIHRTAMSLLCAELLAVCAWSYGSAGCRERPCAAVAEAGRTAASIDIPLLALALVVLLVVRAFVAARRRAAEGDAAARRAPARRHRAA